MTIKALNTFGPEWMVEIGREWEDVKIATNLGRFMFKLMLGKSEPSVRASGHTGVSVGVP